MEQEHHHRKRHIPVRRIIFWIGISLILFGYAFLSMPAETLPIAANARAFIGLGLVILGAALWLGAAFFS